MALDVEGIEGHKQNDARVDRIQLIGQKKSAEDNGTEEIYKSNARQG